MDYYDYIICGGGCAGLSLAWYISCQEKLKNKKVLIIEPFKKDKNDRTWCFWSRETTPFEKIISYKWDKLEINGPGSQQLVELGQYRYNMIKGIDFYRFITEKLQQAGNFTFLNASVTGMENNSEIPYVYTDNGIFHGGLVFNSFRIPHKKTDKKFHHLSQHFLGWEIKTEQDIFYPEIVRLMDFRVNQQNQCRFVYILPFSANHGLVEFTVFSEQLLPEIEYEEELRSYIKNILKIEKYSLEFVEQGVIPMSDQPNPKAENSRIINIGTAGGMVKPATGYAFKRIQKYTSALAEALAENRPDPAKVIRYSSRYRFYDSLLLDIIAKQGETARDIFITLFKNNPGTEVLKFLDEENNIAGDLKIMASVPPAPFLRAIKNAIALK